MTFGAALVRGLTGFGMAIILVPLLSIIMRPDKAVTLAILLQLLIGPVGIRQTLATCHRSSAGAIAMMAVMTTPIGVWLLIQTPPDVARIALAAIALGAFVLTLLQRKSQATPSRGVAIVAGGAAGVLTGFAAMPGPPVVPFYLREAFTPVIARASMMAVFFATSIAGTLSVWALGLLTWPVVVLGLSLFVPMVIGNALGGRGFGKISPSIWRSLVALLLGVAGAGAVWRLMT
jgi:uncharacterized protein